MPDRASVFISYAHRDGAELAVWLHNCLRERGHDVWLDQERLSGGTSWSREIERALDGSDVVLALLSSGSYESEICRGEQLRSLRKGKSVIPILAHADAERPVYLESRQYRDFSKRDATRLDHLIADIDGRAGAVLAPSFRETCYDTVPPLPPAFISRPTDIEALRQTVLSDRDRQGLVLLALCGMGGLGKTVLAQALCRDEAVLAAFPDGVVWVRIGEKPTESDLITQMREAAKALGGSVEGYDTLGGSSTRLRNLLKDKMALLVVDDVWQADHAFHFQPVAARCCRLLITTRDATVAAAMNAHTHKLDVLDLEQSQLMLGSYACRSVDELPPEATDIVRECRGLPIALAMIGAMLRDEPTARWADVSDALTNADLEEIGAKFPNYPYPSLAAVIDASVQGLTPETGIRYLDLAVFPEDTAIPQSALSMMWGVEDRIIRRTVSELVGRSLAVRVDSDRLILHDLQLDYLRHRVRGVAGGLVALHNRLLDRYRRCCAGAWPNGPRDGYFFVHLIHHLREAGRDEEARALLCDLQWISSKLTATDAASLLSDYASAAPDETLALIKEALHRSIQALSQDPAELSGQLLGRLRGTGRLPIKRLLEQAHRGPGHIWFRPRFASLTPPEGCFQQVLAGHSGSVLSLVVLGDGSQVLSGSEDGTLRLWDLQAEETIRVLEGHTGGVRAVAVVNAGRHVLSASSDGTLRLWDLETGKTLRVLQGHTGSVNVVVVLSDGHRALSGSDDKTLRLWNLKTGKTLTVLEGHTDWIRTVAVLSDGRRALSGSNDHTLRMWDLETSRSLRLLEGHTDRVITLGLLSDDRRALSGSEDGTLRLWNLETGKAEKTLRVLNGHTDWIRTVAILDEGRHALCGSKDRRLRMLDLESGDTLRELEGHTDWVRTVAVLRDGVRALSGSDDRTLRLWDLRTGVTLRVLKGDTRPVYAVSLLADGRRALSGSIEGTLRLWDLVTGETVRVLKGHTDLIRAVAILDDGRRALSAANDRSLRLWDLETGETLQVLEGHKDWVRTVANIGDGRRALSGSDDGTLRLWDLESGETLRILEGHTGGVRAIAVLPEGRCALSGSADRTLRLWDIATGETLQILSGHVDRVSAVAIVGGGDRALSSAVDRNPRLWDLIKGETLRVLEGHTDSVRVVRVLRDGRRALSGSADRTLRLWDLDTGAQVARFTADAEILCIDVAEDLIAAGCADGNIHVLELSG